MIVSMIVYTSLYTAMYYAYMYMTFTKGKSYNNLQTTNMCIRISPDI